MAPRFEAAGFASFLQCKFRLKALDDWKVRCYFDVHGGMKEVAARYRGLTQEQFNSLTAAMEQYQGCENDSIQSIDCMIQLQSFFDSCYEQALGRKPIRKQPAAPSSHRSVHVLTDELSNQHSHSPPSPESKQLTKRASLRSCNQLPHSLQEMDASSTAAATSVDSGVDFDGAHAAGQRLELGGDVVWLQCNSDRCKLWCLNRQLYTLRAH
jgi:hypothetical protein